MSGTVIDKATALKHSVAGSTINKIVCKASSRDLAGPKKKHIDYLITLTNNPHVSMPTLADMIGERLRNTNWISVMKALITSHNLMTLGNEKYLQCLATRTNPFDLETFSDRSTVLASEMTRYIHKYSSYLGCYCTSYRATVIDIYRMPRGDQSPLRSMEQGKLLKASTTLQLMLDLILEFDISQGELTNGVINTAFIMLYKDLVKLYAVYNDAVINVLESFFEMKKAQCKEAIDVYRKFLTRQEPVQRFLKLAEEIGVDQKAHLNLRQVPADLLTALEQHLDEMDSIRKTATTHQPSPQIKAASEKLSELKDQSNLSSGKSTPIQSPPLDIPSASQETIEAQKKRFEELKKRASEKVLGIDPVDPNPFTDTPTAFTTDTPFGAGRVSPEGDEFDKIAASRSTPQAQAKHSGGGASNTVMDDLLSLGPQFGTNNPWVSASTTSGGGASFNPFQSQPNPWGGGYQEVNLFPQKTAVPPPTSNSPLFSASSNGLTGGGDLLQPIAVGPLATPTPPQPKQRLTTDIDSSLAQAAASLDLSTGIVPPLMNKQLHQWSSPTPQQTTLTGGPMYQRPQMIQPTTLPPANMGQPVDWSMGVQYGGYGFQQQQQPMGMYGMSTGFQQQPWGQPSRPMMGGGMQGSFYPQQQQQPFF